MEELELNRELLDGLRDYMFAKKYPYNTRRTYGYTIKKMFKEQICAKAECSDSSEKRQVIKHSASMDNHIYEHVKIISTGHTTTLLVFVHGVICLSTLPLLV